MRQHAQPHSSTSEKFPSSLSDSPVSVRLSGIETSFTVRSCPRTSHVIGDQESLSSLSAINLTDLPYHTLEEYSRHPTHDVYHYPLRLDNEIFNHPRQYLRHHILPVNRINNCLQYSAITRNRELTRLTHTSIELKFEVTVKFIGLNIHLIPTSTQIKHQMFPVPSVVTSQQFTSTDHPPFDRQGGTYNFLQPYLWSVIQNPFLKFMTLFSAKSMILLSVKFNFSSLQIAEAITCENLIQPDDPRIT